MERLYLVVSVVVLLILYGRVTTATWCVVRSEASREALQAALDYACGAGADCAPIQQTGLCFLPNTIQAHASYPFNSYYMRRYMDPGSCYFAGTATFAKTDPSYGSCTYPASPSTAGGAPTFGGGETTTITTPNIDIIPPPRTPFNSSSIGGVVNSIGKIPRLTISSNAKAWSKLSISRTRVLNIIFLMLILWMFV